MCGIVAQPFQIWESVGEKVRRHAPDLLLNHSDGAVTVVDVKPTRRMTDPLVREVFDWTSELVGLRGWRFEQWSDVDPVELANVRFLAGYRRPFTVATELCAPVLELVDGQLSIGGVETAAASFAAPETVRPVLLHLLWCSRLATDMSSPLVAGLAGEAAVNDNVIDLRVGAQLLVDGDVVTIVKLDGGSVTVRLERTGYFTALILGV